MKTIYARITTNSSAINALDAIGISMNKATGEAKNAEELIGEVANKWSSLSSEQQRSTSVGIAGIYQLSRFNALMLNYDTALSATETSLNSYNSAMREQEKYNQSLEARMNNLSNAFYGFADAASETIIYDSIVTATSALEFMTKAGSSAVGSIALMSTSMGLLLAPLTLVSTRLTGFTTGLIKSTAQKQLASASAGTLTARMWGLAAGTTAASTAFRSLLMVTGIGIGIAVLTGGISLLINRFSEAKQEAEEFETYMKKNSNALGENKEKVDELLESYYQMSDANKEAWDTEQHQKYIDVQNQLAELFPALIDKVDENGNAHIKSKDAVAEETERVLELIEAEKELKKAQAQKTFGDGLDEIDSLSSKRKTLDKTINSSINNLSTSEIAAFNLEMLKLEQNIADKSAEIRQSVLDIADAYTETGLKISSVVDNQINKAISNIDLSKLSEVELEKLAIDLSAIRVEMNEAFSQGNVEGVESVNKKLQSLIISSIGLKPEIDKVSLSTDEMNKAMQKANITLVDTSGEMDGTTQSVDALSSKIEELQENLNNLSSPEELLVGVSEKTLEDSNELLFLYRQLDSQLSNYTDKEIQALYSKKQLSDAERNLIQLNEQRAETISLLNILYPQYAKLQEGQISLTHEQVEAMKQEEEANRVLLEAYQLAKEGKLSAEQEMTVAQAMATKARIDNIKKEILALDVLNQELQKYINNSKDATDDEGRGSMRASMLQQNNFTAISNKTSELENLQSQLTSSISGIKSMNTSIRDSSKSEKASTKASKESNETKKESIYLSDKYKEALEKLNLEIERQQAIQASQPEHANTYRKSLEAQLKLEREKLALIESQSETLDKQIKSGKIAQTGSVTIGEGNAKSTTTAVTKKVTNRKLSGWDGRITDTYGTVRAVRNYVPHSGVDLAGKKGTKLESNVNGKVIAAGNSKLSGNYVQILDDKGMKHFYGHLDKIVTKLGDVVKVGTHIGNIGNTGNSTGSHLHYEIKNAQGKNFDPMTYVKAAKGVNAIVTTSNTKISTVVSNTLQSIDEAKSALNGLQSDALNSQKAIDELVQAIIESQLASYDYRRENSDSHYAHEEAKLKVVNKESTRYNATLDKMSNLLQNKQAVNNEELEYLQGLIDSGSLSAIQLDNMEKRTLALKTAMHDLNDAIGQLALDRIENFYNNRNEKNDYIIDYERTKLEGVDFNSPRYVATLEKIYKHQGMLYENALNNIKDIEDEIISKGLTGDAFTRAQEELARLTNEVRSLENDMSQTQFEITVNVKTKSDEIIDDLQFEIDRSKAIQSLYDEGSLEYNNEIAKQIELYKEQARIHDESRRKHQEELLTRQMLPNEIKATTEALEDETIAYWNAIGAIDELTKAQKENVEQARKDKAEDVINALKDAYQEFQDDKMRHIDEEVEAAEKLHEKRMKQLEDEMELYRKNVQEKLDLIDKQEAERDYNMEIDEMEASRNEVQSEYDGLSMDNSYEATKRKAELEKELDEIDKEIAEKRHDRNIELQKENLNNLLEDKEVEIEKREELEESRHEKVITELEREREYWQKHYTDLLNDERKFQQIRDDIIAGHLDKVQAEFNGYIDDLEKTMPELVDTLNGTMDAVGTAIRQNVIDNLRLAMEEYDKLMKKQSELSSSGKKYEDDYDPNKGKDSLNVLDNSSNGVGVGKYADKPINTTSNGGNGNSSNKTQTYSSLNINDFRVMLGKYLSDVLEPQYPTGSQDRKALQQEGSRIAKLGRENGSQIPKDSGFNTEIKKFTSSQVQQFKTFANGNSDILNGKYKTKLTSGIASLDSGGFIKRFGQGIDGKGGGLSIVHPNEVIESPYDVDQLVKHSTILDKVMSMVAPALSKLPQLKLPAMQGMMGDNIEVHFHVEEMIANKSSADSFATRFAEKVRTTKGGFRK